MNVFITGATGWIGSATVDELLRAGYKVVGLARSDVSAASLEEKGATALRGDLDDLDALRRGASEAEAVIHLANKHDWANPTESDRAERAAVETLAETLIGTDRPFIVANAISGLVQGRPVLEADPSPAVGPGSDRGGSENLALDYVGRGVRTIITRFAPTVHGTGDWGFINFLISAARRQGVSGYIGDGSNAWSAVHRSDAARLLRLGLEKAPAGSRLHAIAEEAITTRSIAEAIGRTLDIPVASIASEDADAHFGLVGSFFKLSMTGSSERTRELLGWTPASPTLMDDIKAGAYKHVGKP
ncbi:SDR family oxidoreductase [Paenibacillus xylanivorans]|uniref:3-beta hydroxysteroid dehydrogenase n=1 Tax=Paenibacillus xylanivorans TaxID=1705561 RepID=A0A0N0UHY3_9BACL|nr:SDR family oxidoreductase [Paenibacillus xylanivorans]KOY16585.1 3-beta hydroxysteroid dehydrogenase [Paenibacillus xylanivorans]